MQERRLGLLRKAMEEAGLEAVLLTNRHNRAYMTGFTGTSGYVVVTGTSAALFTDFRYMTQAAQQVRGYEIIEHALKPMETIREYLLERKVKRLGFEQNDVSYGTYTSYKSELAGVELVPAGTLVEKLRVVKDETEIAVLREAADLADRTFSYILGRLRPGVSEKELDLEMEFYMRKHGAASSSFETIVASGERSALPHGVASDRLISAGEFVKFDFGAYYKGYCSDLTRTVMLGKPTDKHREIYEIVLDAQLAVLDKLKPGMTGSEADAIARDRIAAAGYGEYFGHGTGHGIGMEIHEAPRLSRLSDTVLEPGMVVTVEPGIYLPGFGGVRIEDDVVITENGIEILTRSDKQFTVIDA